MYDPTTDDYGEFDTLPDFEDALSYTDDLATDPELSALLAAEDTHDDIHHSQAEIENVTEELTYTESGLQQHLTPAELTEFESLRRPPRYDQYFTQQLAHTRQHHTPHQRLTVTGPESFFTPFIGPLEVAEESGLQLLDDIENAGEEVFDTAQSHLDRIAEFPAEDLANDVFESSLDLVDQFALTQPEAKSESDTKSDPQTSPVPSPETTTPDSAILEQTA